MTPPTPPPADPPVPPADYKKGFWALAGIATTANVALPFVGDFASMSPPLFAEVSWIVGFTAPVLAAICFYLVRTDQLPERDRRRAVRRRLIWAARLLAGSLIAVIGYAVLIQISTVINPQTEKRWQIGFGLVGWSLTDTGSGVLQDHPNSTSTDLLLRTGNFRDGGPAKVWHQWSILLSGTALIVLYLATFILFTAAWSIVARYLYEHGAANPTGGPKS